MSTDTSSTPMMQQYRELKARDPDALLLFRMGDFYEMFGDDAERAGALLGLAVTSRDKGPDAIPMAGFPHPALETYLAKLVGLGQRAAVCEQARAALFAHFGTTTLGGFGVEDDASSVPAAGALLSYLKETQKSAVGHLHRLTPHRRGATLALGEMTRRSLELTKTLREGVRE